MTRPDLKAMSAGRRRAQREREKLACQRVRDYRRWLAEGSVLRKIPAVPSDSDWKIARSRGLTP